MYGFVHCALAEMIVTGFGEDKWKSIVREAGIELGGGSFLIHKHYRDEEMWKLWKAAAKTLGTSLDQLLERFGESFIQYCINSGYDRLLKVLGGNLYDFLTNLDALHEHLSATYPSMRAPSFRCAPGEEGSLTLHYYSDRHGLEHFVIGLVRTAALHFFDTSVKVTVLSRQNSKQEHTVFCIKEDACSSIVIRKRSSSMVTQLHKARASTNPREMALSVSTFCQTFPFHMMFDHKMEIKQAGRALLRILKNYRKRNKNLNFNDLFQVVRPVLNVSFDSILHHINTVFIVCSRPGVITSHSRDEFSRKGEGSDDQGTVIRLKGQMVFAPESDNILFLCSPRVTDIEDLRDRGVYLSDIPMHDATRDLILITQARRAERELVEKLEETSNNLQKLQTRLQEDKQRTDSLLHSILPSSVAERLRLNQAVEAEKYSLVTILFSDIVGFTAMCGNENVVPMDVVRLLNKLYTQFDVLSNIHDVYKVETIGDAYMVVGGMPRLTPNHADSVAAMAFGMIDVSRTVLSPVESRPIQIRIGIHSGPCVAGVVGQKMPRYCLFGNSVTIASQMENLSMPGKVNISEVAKGYLRNPVQYTFEENSRAAEGPCKSFFIRNRQNLPRPSPGDLGIPIPQGMFKTPNPSPATSKTATPVEYKSPPSSPIKTNSPEVDMPKFKMPAIHICDADEEPPMFASGRGHMTQAGCHVTQPRSRIGSMEQYGAAEFLEQVAKRLNQEQICPSIDPKRECSNGTHCPFSVMGASIRNGTRGGEGECDSSDKQTVLTIDLGMGSSPSSVCQRKLQNTEWSGEVREHCAPRVELHPIKECEHSRSSESLNTSPVPGTPEGDPHKKPTRPCTLDTSGSKSPKTSRKVPMMQTQGAQTQLLSREKQDRTMMAGTTNNNNCGMVRRTARSPIRDTVIKPCHVIKVPSRDWQQAGDLQKIPSNAFSVVSPSKNKLQENDIFMKSSSGRGGVVNKRELLDVGVHRIEENGRLVVYFRGRPRSLSPGNRLDIPVGGRLRSLSSDPVPSYTQLEVNMAPRSKTPDTV